MPGITWVELDEDLAKFRFLCEIPTLEITPTLEEEECLICQEPYQNDGWELGQKVHRPLALPCGHVLGFRCLALWMLSTNFDNHCPLCRTKIYDPLRAREQLTPALALSFAQWEVFAVTAHFGISRIQKSWLLRYIDQSLRGDNALCTTTENVDRIMVVWEEFLLKICNKPARPDEGNPAAIRGHHLIANSLIRTWDQMSRFFLPVEPEELVRWLCLYVVSVGLAVLLIWGVTLTGVDKRLIAMIASPIAFLNGYIVNFLVSTSRVPWGYKIVSSLVAYVLIRRFLL